jgi:hypothetical protein
VLESEGVVMDNLVPYNTTGGSNTGLMNGNCQVYPYINQIPYYYYPIYIEPKVCSTTVHVFPCSHCKKCQCGLVSLPNSKE